MHCQGISLRKNYIFYSIPKLCPQRWHSRTQKSTDSTQRILLRTQKSNQNLPGSLLEKSEKQNYIYNDRKDPDLTENTKQIILELAISRLKAGDTREMVRADLEAAGEHMSEEDWKDFLNEAVIKEVHRHNANLPAPDMTDYSPRPLDFHMENKISITCKDGKWSAEPASPEFLDWERHMLPTPGSKAIHCKGGIITSELLPETWDGVKKWQEENNKK